MCLPRSANIARKCRRQAADSASGDPDRDAAWQNDSLDFLDATAIDRRTWYVRFGSQAVLAETPPKTPYPGQSFYLTAAEEP